MITNKKIAITGENSGIGQSIKQVLERDNEIKGFSIDGNGYDLSIKEHYSKALEQIKECDILINNAYTKNYRMLQVDLLNDMFDNWQHNEHKAILTVGSQAQYVSKSNLNEQRYATSKMMISDTVDRIKYSDHKCGVITVSPFWVRTPMYEKFILDNPNYVAKSLLEASEVANHVVYLLDLFYNQSINIYCSEIRKKLVY